jgi:uridine kinase
VPWCGPNLRTNTYLIYRYLRYVKPAYDNFVGPTSRHADIVCPPIIRHLHFSSRRLQIVPGNDNAVAIELISTHIRRQLEDRSNHFRKQMASTPVDDRLSFLDGETASSNLILLPQTPQLKVEPSNSWK